MKKSQQSALRRLAVTTLVTIASAVTAVTTQAAYIVNATEVGGDVVFEGSGSIDTAAWSFNADRNRSAFVQPNDAFTVGASLAADYYSGAFSGPATIGPGTAFTTADSRTGDYTGINWNFPALFLPSGYVSGQPIAGTATYAAATFATLGITPGSYQWTWGSGATADSLTLNVGAVPIPAAAWLFGSGLLGLVGVARRKARA